MSPRKGSIPVRQCPRAACSPATPLRQLPPPLRRDATPSAHRPATLYHPSLHTSANFLPTANCHPKPFLALFSSRITPPPTSAPSPPRRHPLRASSCCPPPPLAPYLCQLPLACTTTRPVSAPLRPLLLSSGRAEEAPRRAGHRLPSPKYAQPTHRPNTHKKRAASAAGCRPMERMRRLYSRSSPVSSATGGS